MLIKNLKLHNIRSYTDARLEFPEGIVMLSGDIGSGKSTTLLAMEFALFGLLRGELSGSALLRSGTRQGSVELCFEVAGKEYTIYRTLKRSKTSVEQASGYIIIDGIKQEATASELKSKIIELLGYPQELLTKSKNFVYRYTVYTPQEDMKRILMDSAEQRLVLLRRVFDIDKYARITENAAGYAKDLRERKRALDVLLIDMNDKKAQEVETAKTIEETRINIEQVEPLIKLLGEQITASKIELSKIELQKTKSEEKLRRVQVLQAQANIKEQQQKSMILQVEQIKEQLAQELPIIPDTEELAVRQNNIAKTITEHENTLRELTTAAAEAITRRRYAEETVQKVAVLDHCPTCLQDVTEEHKCSILSTEKEKIDEYEKKHALHEQNLKQVQETFSKLRIEFEAVRKQQHEANMLKLKHKHAEEAVKRKQLLEEQHSKLLDELILFQEELKQLKEEPVDDIAGRYQEARQKHDMLLQKERELSMTHSALIQKEESSKTVLQRLKEEISKKEAAKEKLEKTQQIHHWLTDYFVPLIDVIEKHVMAKIHHEFNALFQQWFGMLVEDAMTARLDETFTPLVQQNGYDVEVENLSGGERTACALAYRLALNKTINSLISNIRTKDLLILDEPTDGFSTEQLDKMREVLAQLNLKQIIIVSHEQKVEGFADSIIRVQKEEFVSRAVLH